MHHKTASKPKQEPMNLMFLLNIRAKNIKSHIGKDINIAKTNDGFLKSAISFLSQRFRVNFLRA
jgi:hypothetical protein